MGGCDFRWPATHVFGTLDRASLPQYLSRKLCETEREVSQRWNSEMIEFMLVLKLDTKGRLLRRSDSLRLQLYWFYCFIRSRHY